MYSSFENHQLKGLERRATLDGKHGSLVLFMFAIHASPTEIGVCMGFFYLVAANCWQLSSGEEETQRALCTHTLFAEPPKSGRLYSNSRMVMSLRKRASGSPKPPAVTATAFHCVSGSISAPGRLRLFLPNSVMYLVQIMQYKFVSLPF